MGCCDRAEPRASGIGVKLSPPPEVATHLPDFDWEVREVWRLRAPTRTLELTYFEPWLALPFWSSGSGMLFDVCPVDVLRDPAYMPHQWDRIMRADLSYPIDVLQGPEERLLLLDGLHRISRAVWEGRRTMEVRVHASIEGALR